MNNIYLIKAANAWVKRKTGPGEIIRIIPDVKKEGAVLCYNLYNAFEETPDYLGCLLFDGQGYWIYDGNVFSIHEQEQLAKFIINYVEIL